MPGKVTHAYTPSTWETEAEDHEFKVSIGYIAILGAYLSCIARPCLKKNYTLNKSL
jgi:hypothetical protein